MNIKRIRHYLYKNARALDVARFRYHFEGGSPGDVLSFLSVYQNEDHGFGHGLEPDNQSPHSSPIQTWAALRILRRLHGAAGRDHMIQEIFDYLYKTEDFDGRKWPGTVPSTNAYAHAPWWHYNEGVDLFRYNPTAELTGYILRFADKSSALYKRAESIVTELVPIVMQPSYNLSGHELANVAVMYRDLIIASRLDLVPESFAPFLSERIKATIETDPSVYREPGNYYMAPSLYISGKDSPYYEDNAQAAEDYADYLMESLHEDGYWDIYWSWGKQEMDDCVRRDWRGALSVDNLLFLKGMGRI